MKYTPEEKKEIRKEFKEDPLGFWIKPTIEYWKTEPKKAILTFITWAGIFYLIFVMIQATNYDMLYCTSNIPEYNGKMLEVYNGFINYTNKKIEIYNKEQMQGIRTESKEEYIEMLKEDTITCKYNITRWWNEEKNIRKNARKIILRQ